MKKLYGLCGPTSHDDPRIPQGAEPRRAFVLAENDDEASKKARLLGIPGGGQCLRFGEGSAPERIPEEFIGRVLSWADLDELQRLLADPADSETLEKARILGVDAGGVLYTKRSEAAPREYVPEAFLEKKFTAAELEDVRQLGPLCDDAQRARLGLGPWEPTTMRDLFNELAASLKLK